MSYPANPINVYTCQQCNGQIVTIDRHEGVTPSMLRCRASKGCNGTMLSAFYSVPQDLKPDYEWRKPTKGEYYRLDIETRRDHVDRGGLLLYPLDLSTEERRPARSVDMHKLKIEARYRKLLRKVRIRTLKAMTGRRLTAQEMARMASI